MKAFLKGGLGLAALAGTLVAAAAPAEAQRWGGGPGWNRGGGYYGGGYRGYRRGGDRTGVAIGAGVLGLALGAAIASNGNRGYYDRGYDRGYYAPPPRSYYSYDYCRPVWDAYRDRYVRVCD